MKDRIKFLVYSDIHYDRLGAGCITTEDCESAESRVLSHAVENNMDFTIFCGDRFLKRDPEDEIKTRADRVLLRAWGEGLLENCPNYRLIGNHDWTKNNKSWHTSESLLGIPNIIIMDKPGSYPSEYMIIQALPAGCYFDPEGYGWNTGKFEIFIFHDILYGSYLDGGSYTADFGMERSSIDIPEFNMVFGGDIHIPQMISFKNTQGGYVGSVIQRTMADANDARGWLDIEATLVNGQWHIDKKFVPTRNFFSKIEFEVDATSRFEGLHLDESLITDQYVEIALVGSKSDVDRIAADKRWLNYETFYNARKINIAKKYKVEQDAVVINIGESSNFIEDLHLYLESGFSNITEEMKGKVKEKVVGVVKELENG